MRKRDFPSTNTCYTACNQTSLPSVSASALLRLTHSSAPQAGEEWVVPRSPRGPRPPPLPGESVYSGSSGRDDSCSASHRLIYTHTHTVIHKCYRDSTLSKIQFNQMKKKKKGPEVEPSWEIINPKFSFYQDEFSADTQRRKPKEHLHSEGQEVVTKHTQSNTAKKKKLEKKSQTNKKASRRTFVLISSKWGLHNDIMHGERLVFVSQRENSRSLSLLTCMMRMMAVLLTVAGVRLVPLLQRRRRSLRFLLAVLVTPTLKQLKV